MPKQQMDAIYENGVLRPLTPLDLAEQQRVVIVIGVAEDEGDERDSEEYIPIAAEHGDPSIIWEQVHEALSSIPGSLSDDIIRDREDRC
jgi:predicted DNA-binding antitoxin AbrB/MazE fold protein